MKQLGEIRVSNRSSELVIDIEGTIGVPEWWQFESDDQRVATYEKFREKVEEITRTSARRVRVNIRSVGGNVNDALLIYEALCGLEAEQVTTLCQGYVASAATIVAQAASVGRRLVSSNALYLVHNATTALEGNQQDAERTARLLDKTDERIAEIYATRSSRPAEEFRALMAREGGRGEWLSPEETVAAGLADCISEASPLAAMRQKVRDFFGRSGGAVSSVVSNAVLRLLESPASEANGEVREAAEEVAALSNRIQALQEQVEQLGGENARLRALPSTTLLREDPALTTAFSSSCEQKMAGNLSAYEGDVAVFHTSY